ncbi:MAG: hypothetical protein B6245_23450 [Desulfobacteraceae bacterium 4572_88]|nr:MAG: hypothetical protein B6245_23450 [Desulfobacteraceae bacterium 4572_88]
MGAKGMLEGVIPFIILFTLLFFVHSKLYDLLSYLYDKIKEKFFTSSSVKEKVSPAPVKKEVRNE